MDKFQLLALKKAVTVYEAAQLLTRGNGGASAAEALIVEAIELGELAANVTREQRDPFDFSRSKPGIFPMMTTIQRADLDAWLSSKGLSIAVLPLTPPAPSTTTITAANVWDEHGLRRLLSESLLPGMTQQKLAVKYGVTRQRIGALLKDASPKKADPFSALMRRAKKEK